MKVYKVELLIIDFDKLGADEINEVIENTSYPNHCISPHVMEITELDIGDWEDSNPLNNTLTRKEEYEKLFD